LISLLGFSVGALLSGSLLVEVITSWRAWAVFVGSDSGADLYVVVGGVLLSTIFLVGGNFIADVLLFWADPRIRTE